MNILHITTFLQGGAGRIIKDLACHQKKSDNKVFVITTSSEEEGYCNYSEYIESLKDNNIKVYKIDSTFKRDIYLNLNVVSKVREIIINENIDIIHAHAAVPAMVGIIARSGMDRYIPVIQTMHGWGVNKRIEQEKMDITIINGLDKLITVSKSDKNIMIKKGIDSSLIDVIYNGIEPITINMQNEDEIVKDIKEHKKSGFKIIGLIGTVCYRKNQELVVNMLEHCNQKIFCPVIGEGEIINKLRKKVIKLGLENNIKFYGYKENAVKYLKFFDYQLITSLSEGFGVVIIESFSEKTPVIGSDIDVFKEIINNGENGYLFQNNDFKSLLNVIDYVLNENVEVKNKIITNAYEDYNKHFKVDMMYENYDKEYIKLIQQRRF